MYHAMNQNILTKHKQIRTKWEKENISLPRVRVEAVSSPSSVLFKVPAARWGQWPAAASAEDSPCHAAPLYTPAGLQ